MKEQEFSVTEAVELDSMELAVVLNVVRQNIKYSDRYHVFCDEKNEKCLKYLADIITTEHLCNQMPYFTEKQILIYLLILKSKGYLVYELLDKTTSYTVVALSLPEFLVTNQK